MVRFARECLEQQVRPVFLAHPLGRGQEVLGVLCEAGIPAAVDEALARFIPVYEASGYRFPRWAALDNARKRTGAEELIPYSDHADFEELLALVRESGAQQVEVVHGYARAFAHLLRQAGWQARAPLAGFSCRTVRGL